MKISNSQDLAIGAPNCQAEEPLAQTHVSRRHFVTGASATFALAGLGLPTSSQAIALPESKSPEILTGTTFNLQIGYQPVNFTGTKSIATTVNGSLPGPTLRWREGQRVTIRVTNNLHEDSSIHWHGIILPSTMDGSPGFDSEPIKPGATFEYQFEVQQSGTYWYHSHSGFQEQTGVIGAIIIDPKEPDPVKFDRELVVQLSDWSDQLPTKLYAKLKKKSDYYNFQQRTLGDWWRDVKAKGFANTLNERSMWNHMRMSQGDIADVTGHAYTYLMNGVTPDRWIGLCKPGETVRLRIINGAAMSIFDVRIPGLVLTVVAADGQNIQPVCVDEFRIGVAETYDILVTPATDRAYTLFAQTIDRTGYARGTLTCNTDFRAEVPAMDLVPVLGHRDMGMDMGSMDHSGHDMTTLDAADHNSQDLSELDSSAMNHSEHDMSATDKTPVDHTGHNMDGMDMSQMNHSAHVMPELNKTPPDQSGHNMGSANKGPDQSGHDMGTMATPQAHAKDSKTLMLAKAGFGSNFDNGEVAMVSHYTSEYGPNVDMRTMSPKSGLADPGIGLRNHQKMYARKVLTYADLRSLHPTRDKRQPTREIELHLTGNMHRYIWSLNGIGFADAKPLKLAFNERVRIILINDTMMTHPIHLHGMWSELETGDPDFIPRKHTVIVQPGAKISYLLTADAKGRWAYHCHLLYHMLGMMRVVEVI